MGQYPPNSLDEGRITFDTHKANQPRDVSMATTKAKDIVCGNLVDPRDAHVAFYAGHSYYFCSPECQVRFEADPTKFSSV